MSERRVVRHRPNQTQLQSSKPSKAKSQKPTSSYKKIFKTVLYSTIFLLLVYALTASPLLRVKKIQVTGLQTLTEANIHEQVQAIVDSSLMNQNMLLISTEQINKQLKANNYQVAKAEVTRIPFNTIKVTITEQKPSILWKSNGELSILTEDGRAYAGEPNDELKANLPTVLDAANLPAKAGEKVVSESFLKFVNTINTSLPTQGVKVIQYEVQETTTELFVVTQDGYKLRFDTSRPAQEQITDLVTVLDQLKKQGKKPAEYIDLRINGKVFYK